MCCLRTCSESLLRDRRLVVEVWAVWHRFHQGGLLMPSFYRPTGEGLFFLHSYCVACRWLAWAAFIITALAGIIQFFFSWVVTQYAYITSEISRGQRAFTARKHARRSYLIIT